MFDLLRESLSPNPALKSAQGVLRRIRVSINELVRMSMRAGFSFNEQSVRYVFIVDLFGPRRRCRRQLSVVFRL